MHRNRIRATADGVVRDVAWTTLIAGEIVVYDGNALSTGGLAIANIVRNTGTSTDNAIARFDLTTGKIIQNSGIIIDDSNNVTGMGTLNTRTIANWVDGPASATVDHIPVFNSSTGKLLRDSGKSIGTMVSTSSGSTDNAVARFDSTSGLIIQNSGVIIDDSNNVTGLGTLNTRTIASWVDGPASSTNRSVAIFNGTTGKAVADGGINIDLLVDSTSTSSLDNALARFDGTGGITIQNSVVTISDTGEISGVLQLNGVDPSTWIVGNDALTGGSKWVVTNKTGLSGNKVCAAHSTTNAGVISGTTTVQSFGYWRAGNIAAHWVIPYALSDTSGNVVINVSWSSGTGSVAITCGNYGAVTQTSGSSANIAKSGIPPAGAIVLDAVITGITGTAQGMTVTIANSGGSSFSMYVGYVTVMEFE